MRRGEVTATEGAAELALLGPCVVKTFDISILGGRIKRETK